MSDTNGDLAVVLEEIRALGVDIRREIKSATTERRGIDTRLIRQEERLAGTRKLVWWALSAFAGSAAIIAGLFALFSGP